VVGVSPWIAASIVLRFIQWVETELSRVIAGDAPRARITRLRTLLLAIHAGVPDELEGLVTGAIAILDVPLPPK
jgi:hypothetical protein